MRDLGPQSLYDAARDGRAVGAFSTYTMEQTQAICLAAEEAGQPVIIQAGASAFAHSRLAELGPQALLAADLARVRVGVHLDHSRDLAQVRAALEAGYTSVMVDGSHLPFEDNVAMTSAAVVAARIHGAWVEAELGAVPGHEDRSVATASGAAADLTDPLWPSSSSLAPGCRPWRSRSATSTAPLTWPDPLTSSCCGVCTPWSTAPSCSTVPRVCRLTSCTRRVRSAWPR